MTIHYSKLCAATLCAVSLSVSCAIAPVFGVLKVYAAEGLVISEIMFDPSGSDTNREWVEVHNTGTTDVDLAGHFLLTDGVPSTHHALAPQGSSVVAAGAYAIIVQTVDGFKTDNASYSGLIFDSSWSGLTSSSGKTLAIIDSQGTVLDQVTYDPTIGAVNDGNSLQKKSDGTWIAAVPTPGAATAGATATSGSGDTTTGDTSDDSGSSSGQTAADGGGVTIGDSGGGSSAQSAASTPPSSKVSTPIIPHMQAKITIPKTAVTGIPVTVVSSVLGYSGETRTYGAAHIAFGDGTVHDGVPGESFEHTYLYPGTYAVLLEYRLNIYQHDPDVSARAVIDVSNSSVTISRVDANGSIDLANTGKSDADLSGWMLQSLGTPPALLFRIPEGTVILPGKTITLDSNLTGISPTVTKQLGLAQPSGRVSTMYDATAKMPAATIVASASYKSATVKKSPAVVLSSADTEIVEPETAAAIESNSSPRSIWPFLVGFLAAAGCVIFAVQKLRGSFRQSAIFQEETLSLNEDTEAADSEAIRILEE